MSLLSPKDIFWPMNCLDIPIRSITGKKSTFKAHPKHTIGQIKRVLSSNIHVEPSNLHFIYDKNDLNDIQTIESLNIVPGTFLIYYISPQKTTKIEETKIIPILPKKEKTEKPEKQEEQEEEKPSPEKIEEEIQFLQNMGFPRKQCENAIVYTNYRVSLAADLLCTGQIPDEIENKVFNKKFETVVKRLRERGIATDVFIQIV